MILRVNFYLIKFFNDKKWMTPWGYTSIRPSDYDEMMRVAKIGNDALYAVHGTRYRVGSIIETL